MGITIIWEVEEIESYSVAASSGDVAMLSPGVVAFDTPLFVGLVVHSKP